ncbi:phosphate ABC transporter substrate-binding protein PstS [Allosalinactinospora lopnorensis]|uniref:phosphate ABC transporter substrate-binding protein PstS n=1 Tax=Allosalinactinospora lopnorensis TaxID=1352348 RepID=UPI000623FA0D|nr:phosphate ABC transporter substrate-binding protein PstS [Allosalinactinospora lopnorensis]
MAEWFGSVRAGAAAVASALVLTACGSDNAVPPDSAPPAPDDLACPPGNISGAGSSAQENAMVTWVAGYQMACEGSVVYYNSVGSGAGRSQFLDGAVTFGGTDAALDPKETTEAKERCHGSDAINIPAYVVPIAVAFNLPGIDTLNLRPGTIAKIFDQQITHWDDEEIAADNPDLDLPHTPVLPVNRSDESGTTENFTDYLAAAAGDDWPHEPDGSWPIRPAEAGQGNSGVAAAVKGGEGTVGYVEVSFAEGMTTARVGIGEEFVEMSPESAGAIVIASPQREGNVEHDHALELDYNTREPGTYPIVLVSYQVACLTYTNGRDTALLKDFLGYLVSEEGQQAVSEETGSAPLPDDIRAELNESIGAIETR